MEARHDVVIVGGGLVGASLAIALEPLGLDVAMIEATPPGELPAVFDERNLSFAEATCNALQTLGVWPMLRTASPIRRIHVSRRGDFGRAVLDAREHDREAFGHVVIARDFGEALEARLVQLTRLTRYRPATFIGTQMGEDGARLVRIRDEAGERTLHTRLLGGADGTTSAVREALGIGTQRHDYQQTLFVARVRGERAPDGTAFERLGTHGPTALLPRSDRHFGVIHGVAREEAERVAALDEAAWLARLQDAFGWRAGRFVASGPRSAYPIIRVLADALTAPHAVLVGNAAQTIHPIGAQGFNLGLRDALTLVEEIAAQPDDIGSETMLRRYVERRMPDRTQTLAFSDGLARATSNALPLVGLARSAALALLANAPGLRARAAGAGMGYRGDVPAACRKESA